jgi:hypothetical protein
MKSMIVLFVTLFAGSAFGSTLGLTDGTYQADSTLYSDSFLVPDLSFHSIRTLHEGEIDAQTTATLFEIPLAKAHARLGFVQISVGKFKVIDLDTGLTAGAAECNSQGCTYKVTVMNGKLTLQETLIPTASGFDIKNGAQVFEGKSAHYEASFAPLR